MEEKNNRNVEDIVNKLRQPAIITDRKTLKSHRPFESLAVSSFHQKESDCKPPSNSLNTCSLLSLVDKCDTDEKGGQIIYKNYNFDEVKDSSTQTSKTIIQLAKIETGEMSPDSLSPTPRNYNADYSSSNFENFTLDGSFDDYNSCKPSTKATVANYFQSLEQTNEIDKKSVPPPVVSVSGEYPRKSLIETYLEKSRHRMNNVSKSRESTSREIIKYVQPNNPNSIHIDEEPISMSTNHNFKSQSVVDNYHPTYLSPHLERRQPQYTRFTVKNIRERNHLNITYRDTIYESPKAAYRNRRSNSFMLPTVSSEQKSKIDEVRNLRRLISPTRRGRSISPNPKASNRVEIFRLEAERIPYIDQSRSEIFRRRHSPTKERKSLIERAKTPPKISPVLPAADFKRDMMRIDQMSLTLLPSDVGIMHFERRRIYYDSISARTRATDAISIYSSEISLTDLLNRIQDENWNVSLKALADVTDLCRTTDAELMMPHMITINQKMLELLRSPRSHVCRTACQAAGHLFESMKDTRGPEFNDIVDTLLNKTADSNKFIRQDANLALDCMVTHISTFHAIRALCSKGPSHKNHLVRCATVRLIICAVVIAGPDIILNPIMNTGLKPNDETTILTNIKNRNKIRDAIKLDGTVSADVSDRSLGCDGNVLILADSHGRKLSSIVKEKMPNMSIDCLFKPNAMFSSIVGDVGGLTSHYTQRDFVVLCGGVNDALQGKQPSFETIQQTLEKLNHTNVILLLIPLWHGRPVLQNFIKDINHSFRMSAALFSNVTIIDTNKVLKINDFQKSGLHLNNAGKHKLVTKIVERIQYIGNYYTENACALRYINFNNLVTVQTINTLTSSSGKEEYNKNIGNMLNTMHVDDAGDMFHETDLLGKLDAQTIMNDEQDENLPSASDLDDSFTSLSSADTVLEQTPPRKTDFQRLADKVA
ncbi:clasp [Holotrichia oblita]|uniref:Clasp n=1 Tax=Holotrichia oblita TaxID=644536 RepID=A0ACB9SXM9_HOLOL|nr:clasp [Holotrichia oblita]